MTGSDILNIALDLCGLRETTGSVPQSCADLTQRAVSLINLVLAENTFLDSLITGDDPEPGSIATLAETVSISDIICRTVLPLELAALLIADEDEKLSATLSVRGSVAADAIRREYTVGTCGDIVEAY